MIEGANLHPNFYQVSAGKEHTHKIGKGAAEANRLKFKENILTCSPALPDAEFIQKICNKYSRMHEGSCPCIHSKI